MNTNFLNSVTNFIKKRTFEFIGLILISTGIGLAIAFTTYSPEDPSLIYGNRDFEIKNFFGIYGSSVADFLLQSFGLSSFLISKSLSPYTKEGSSGEYVVKAIASPILVEIKINPINSKVRFFIKFVTLFKKFVFISNRITYFLPFL